MLQGGRTFGEVLSVYIVATVGAGLVLQISALLISTATGMIVTRAASENSLSLDLKSQLVSYPVVLLLSGLAVIVMSIIPGFPTGALLLVGVGLIGAALFLRRKSRKTPEQPEAESLPQSETEFYKNTENIYTLLDVEPIEVEVVVQPNSHCGRDKRAELYKPRGYAEAQVCRGAGILCRR